MEPARLFYRRRTVAPEQKGLAYTSGGKPLNVDTLLARIKAEGLALERAPVEAPPRKGSVIDTFNEQADVGAILARKGYIPMGANLWLFPGSTTGMPGVKYFPESGRVYSHHSQDPLHGEHAHDAFSAYTVLEHGGDQKKAVAAAARLLGMRYERESVPPPRLDQRAPFDLHPLARFVSLGGPLRPPKWLIPGFLPEGVVTIAGEPAVGKTTCLLPLALVVAHLCDPENPLRPRHWRHVIFISEDVDQAQRVLKGAAEHGQPRLNVALVEERFHLVEATRLDVEDVVKVGPLYRGEYARNVDGVELLPLVIFDTKSAVLAMQNEDDNAEASATVAALKQRFEGLPLWVIGHVAKAHKGNSNTRELSMRGAGAWEGDPHLTMFIVREQEQRFIVLGKHRFEETWPELVVQSHVATAEALDEFGEPCLLPLRWGVPAPPDGAQAENKQLARERARLDAENALRSAVCEVVQFAWQAGHPLNKSGVAEKVQRKSSDVRRAIAELLVTRRLIEVTIPSKLRTNPKRRSFLVCLTQEEHESVLRGGPVPSDKLAIPPSMRKAQ